MGFSVEDLGFSIDSFCQKLRKNCEAYKIQAEETKGLVEKSRAALSNDGTERRSLAKKFAAIAKTIEEIREENPKSSENRLHNQFMFYRQIANGLAKLSEFFLSDDLKSGSVGPISNSSDKKYFGDPKLFT